MVFEALCLALAMIGDVAAPPIGLDFVTTDAGSMQVTVGNITDRPVWINLGHTVANGKRLVPTHLRLMVSQGDATRELDFAAVGPFSSGRIDDYIVPLAPRGSYRFSVEVSDFFSPLEKDPPLKRGSYTATLALTSRAPSFVNLDMAGVKLLGVWAGTVRSPVHVVERD